MTLTSSFVPRTQTAPAHRKNHDRNGFISNSSFLANTVIRWPQEPVMTTNTSDGGDVVGGNDAALRADFFQVLSALTPDAEAMWNTSHASGTRI